MNAFAKMRPEQRAFVATDRAKEREIECEREY